MSSLLPALSSLSGGKIQGSEVTTEEGPGVGVKHGVPSSHLLRFRESSGALRKDRKGVREKDLTCRGGGREGEAGDEKAGGKCLLLRFCREPRECPISTEQSRRN